MKHNSRSGELVARESSVDIQICETLHPGITIAGSLVSLKHHPALLTSIWAGHVARMSEERGRIGSWWRNRRESDHWEDLGVDGWILGWISRRWDVGMWTGLG